MKLIGGYEKQGNEVIINFKLENNLNTTVDLTFTSGQQFEIYIIDVKGEVVYRYSEDKFFTMAMMKRELTPGESLGWQDSWSFLDKKEETYLKGTYKAIIELKAVISGEAKLKKEDLRLILQLDL